MTNIRIKFIVMDYYVWLQLEVLSDDRVQAAEGLHPWSNCLTH